MNILYVDLAMDGHHSPYLASLANELMERGSCRIGIFAPRIPDELSFSASVEHFECSVGRLGGAKDYLSVFKGMHKAVGVFKPDIVHYLYADSFLKTFGLLLPVGDFKTVATFHQFRPSGVKIIALKSLLSRFDAVVVHTASLQRYFKTLCSKAIHHIEYPTFEKTDAALPVSEARKMFGLNESTPVIACLGSTRKDKGLDVMLEALPKTVNHFQLLVAGQESAVTRQQIESAAAGAGNVHVVSRLSYLKEAELVSAAQAADIIALPYRKIFDGASGPLGIGARLGKTIIGPSHGSIGEIIRENHLGYTFEAENPESLAQIIDEALLNMPMGTDVCYEAYSRLLDPTRFNEEYIQLYERLSNVASMRRRG